MTTTLPSNEQAPAWLPTAEIPVQRSAPPVQAVLPAPDTSPRRTVAARTRRWPAAVGGLAVGLAVGASGAAVAMSGAGAATPVATPASHSPVVSVPGRVLPAFGDGAWQIGVDIAPGTYTSAGAAGTACYRAHRTASTGGEVVSSAVSTGAVTVVLTEDDGWFETFGCATWNRTG